MERGSAGELNLDERPILCARQLAGTPRGGQSSLWVAVTSNRRVVSIFLQSDVFDNFSSYHDDRIPLVVQSQSDKVANCLGKADRESDRGFRTTTLRNCHIVAIRHHFDLLAARNQILAAGFQYSLLAICKTMSCFGNSDSRLLKTL